MIEFILSFRNFSFYFYNFLMPFSCFLFMFHSMFTPIQQSHRLANTIKEAGATTRRDYPFQGSWKAYPWYLSHFLALLPFSIKRGIF